MNLVYRGQTPPLNTNAIWVIDDKIKIFQNGGWKEISGSGIPSTEPEEYLSETSRNLIKNRAVYNQYMDTDDLLDIPAVFDSVYRSVPLTFKILTDGTIKWSYSHVDAVKTIEYSKNNGEWTSITSTSTGAEIPVVAGDVVKFRGDNEGLAVGTKRSTFKDTTCDYDAEGNVMSLLSSTDFASLTSISYEYCFINLFAGSPIINAKNLYLPATTIVTGAYAQLFQGCSKLELPFRILPVNDVPYRGCFNIFKNCTSLKKTPKILGTGTVGEVGFGAAFLDCTSLQEACDLKFKSVGVQGYTSMFEKSGIKHGPEIYATECSDKAMSYMFHKCINLETCTKELRTEVLPTECYRIMFAFCLSLKEAPKIKATEASTSACSNMFMACISLENPPEMNITTIGEKSLYGMFSGCEKLKNSPNLPAMTLASECYSHLFGIVQRDLSPELIDRDLYCSSLEITPVLPATTLVTMCYEFMFYGCSKVNRIECLATDISASYCTRRWVEGVASTGVFIPNVEANWTTGVNGIPEDWEVRSPKSIPLTLNILTDGDLKWKVAYGENPDDSYYYQYETDACKRTIQYSKNGGEWVSITSSLHSEPATAFSVRAGDEIRLRGYNSTYYTEANSLSFGSSFIDSTCTFDMKGNIMSLIDGDNFSSLNSFSATYAFYYVFRRTGIRNAKDLYLINATHIGCYWGLFQGSALITAPDLPAEVLSNSCYRNMFEGCSNLLEAPELPVTTLAELCYAGMFIGCSSLTSTPELPALTMQKHCYANMFDGCTSVSSVPELPATILAEYCYSGMFHNCTSITIVPNNLLPITSLAKHCYQNMFSGCTSLTNTPELPAMSLQHGCYYAMFMMCTSLTATPNLPATTLATDCYSNMFNGCINIVTVMSELPATSAPDFAYAQMFKGCTSITESPDIKATTHGQYTFNVMFQGCSSLSKITCRVTQSNSAYFYNWVDGVAATGTFYKRSGTTWTNGLNGIPTGWSVQNL